MGIKERKDFDVIERPKRRSRVNQTSRVSAVTVEGCRLNLEGRGRTASIKKNGHNWFITEFVKPRRGAYAVLTAPSPEPVHVRKTGKRLRTQGESPPTTAQGRQCKLKMAEMAIGDQS